MKLNDEVRYRSSWGDTRKRGKVVRVILVNFPAHVWVEWDDGHLRLERENCLVFMGETGVTT